jgi:hypothetical protein
MIKRETNSSEVVLIALSMRDTCQDNPSHFKTMKNSANAIIQLMPKIILNLVCDKGDEAIKFKEQDTRNKDPSVRIKNPVLIE